ncbi:MAG: NAD(P)-binding domain-containing protein [Acidobacteriota bacterium]
MLGTGSVGATLAGKLVALGHAVRMGAREHGNEKARAWADSAGENASSGAFADAARFGDVVFNATAGAGSVEAVRAAGKENLKGKVVIDVSNPLDFTQGMPPRLFTAAAGDSLAERIQAELPESRIVKTLNTINASVMVDPSRVGAESDIFLCGNDPAAKEEVASLLKEFGWESVVDLGPLTAARGMEAYVLFWLQLWGALKTPDFNIRIARK